MIRVPKTDEEVIKEINEYSDDLLRRILLGIFECRRGMGTDVLTAWEYTLNAHIECCIDKEDC